MLSDELLHHLFENNTHALAMQCAQWIAASARFRLFATTYRDKIRKKVRGIRDDEGLKDLQFELEIAYLLLEERRFTIEYEKGGVGKQRGPDFSVLFKAHIPFNVEVKRLRQTALDRQAAQPEFSRIVSSACQKIGQMQAGQPNVLVLAADAEPHQPEDIALAMAALRARAERKDDDFFLRRGFQSAADFIKQFPRLSAILLHLHHTQNTQSEGGAGLLWLNASARQRLPADLRNALVRALG